MYFCWPSIDYYVWVLFVNFACQSFHFSIKNLTTTTLPRVASPNSCILRYPKYFYFNGCRGWLVYYCMKVYEVIIFVAWTFWSNLLPTPIDVFLSNYSVAVSQIQFAEIVVRFISVSIILLSCFVSWVPLDSIFLCVMPTLYYCMLPTLP